MNRSLLTAFFLLALSLASAQQQADSLLNALNAAGPAQKSFLSLRLSQVYSATDINKAIEFATQSLNAGQTDEEKMAAYTQLGLLHMRIGNNSRAIEHYRNALELSDKTNNPAAKARAQSALGSAYFISGNLGESLGNYLQALRYYEQAGDPAHLVNIYSGLANIYEKQNNFAKALEYNLLAVRIYESSSNTMRALVGYEQIGKMYIRQGDYDKASEYLRKSLQLYTDLKNKAGEASTRIQLGNVNYQAGRYDEAVAYYRQTIALSRQLKMRPLEAAACNGLALTYEKQKLYDEAIIFARKASDLARSSNLKIELDEAYETLTRLYRVNSEEDKAATFRALSREIKDSLYNDSMLKQLADYQLRYESEKQLRQIDNQQKEQEVLASELLRERQFRNWVIGALVFLTLAFIVFIYLFTQNKRIASSLAKQKKELEITNLEIVKQKEELGQLNNVKDRFFSIVSHDLRNNLTTMKLYFDLVSNPGYTLDIDNTELTRQIASSVENTIDLLENLLVWAQSQIKGVEFNPHVLDVSALLADNINLLRGNAHHKNILLANRAQAGLCVFADADMINLVIRNLVSNAIKFTRPGGEVVLDARQKGETVQISVSDNGVGISKEALDKMFVKNMNPSTLGTGNEKGTGLGLLLCKEFVEKNGGRISVSSTEGQGSVFTVSLPAGASH